jgi:hypothetical protein
MPAVKEGNYLLPDLPIVSAGGSFILLLGEKFGL